jgi:hypothetical protein
MSRKRPKQTHSGKPSEKEEKEEKKEKKKAEKDRFLKRIFGEDKKSVTLVAAVFFVVGFAVSLLVLSETGIDGMLFGRGTECVVVAKDSVGQKVIDYINNNLVPSGSTVSLVSVEEENGMYLVTTSYQGNEIPVYVTKDGNALLIGTVYDMNVALEPIETEPTEEPNTVTSCDNAPKSAKADMTVWVVSQCPYGTQAMNGIYYVAKLFGDKADINVRYITDVDSNGNPTSMHGEAEQNENQRQVCLREEQPDKFWEYVHCYVETGDAVTCETTAGVDSASLDDCFNNRGKNYMIQEAADWATIYQPAGGMGSPSFFMNGMKVSEYSFSQNGRSPDNLKNILCCGMETALTECSEQLNTSNPPTGFGKIGESTSTSSGSC